MKKNLLIVEKFYDELYDEDHVKNFNLTFFIDEVAIDGEDYSTVIKSLKKIDNSLGKELESIINDINLSKEVLYNIDTDKYIGDEIQSLGVEYYDQYNDRLAHALPATFSNDMNGADWRSVESIKDSLHKLDKDLYTKWEIIWNKNYVSQDRLYDFYHELHLLLSKYSDELKTTDVSSDTNKTLTKEEEKWLKKLWKLRDAPSHVISNNLFIDAAIAISPTSLEYASDEYKNDKDILMTAIKSEPLALLYASDKLKNDKELVLEAVKGDGNSLQYASETLRNDKEIVLIALKDTIYASGYIGESLLNDSDILAITNPE